MFTLPVLVLWNPGFVFLFKFVLEIELSLSDRLKIICELTIEEVEALNFELVKVK